MTVAMQQQWWWSSGGMPGHTAEIISIPDHAATPMGTAPSTARIITPSLSSAASEEEEGGEEMDARSRDMRSPSPELDFSDFENAEDPFSNRPPVTSTFSHSRRAQSPPLEKDEREFTMTASFLQQRRRSQEAERARAAAALPATASDARPPTHDTDGRAPEAETEESAAV